MHAVFYLHRKRGPRLIGAGDLDAAMRALRRNTSRGQVGADPRGIVEKYGVYVASGTYAVIDTDSQPVKDVAMRKLARYPGVTHGIPGVTSGPVVGDALLREMYFLAVQALRGGRISSVLAED
jgi:hypothetical protein